MIQNPQLTLDWMKRTFGHFVWEDWVCSQVILTPAAQHVLTLHSFCFCRENSKMMLGVEGVEETLLPEETMSCLWVTAILEVDVEEMSQYPLWSETASKSWELNSGVESFAAAVDFWGWSDSSV